MFEWNADSDSSNEMEPWEEWNILKDMMEREKFEQSAVTPQWRRERFYQSQFPLVLIEKLFGNEAGQCSNEIFESRNFAFVLPNDKGGEPIMAMYKSFRTPVELQDAFREAPPLRVEIGSRGFEPSSMMPVVVKKLSSRGDTDPYAMHTKELVFDVDITEWDDLRDCSCIGAKNRDLCPRCGKALVFESELMETHGYCECGVIPSQLCSRCWCFVKSSMVIMNYILTQRLGFKEVLFVFSGSKGYHCWVFDDDVKYYSEEQRAAIVNYFVPWVDKKRRVLKDELNPILGEVEDAFLEGLFLDTIVTNELFTLSRRKQNRHLNKLLGIKRMSPHIREQFVGLFDTAFVEKWNSFTAWNQVKAFIHCYFPAFQVLGHIRRILYSYLFPRIDVPITAQIKHLIKLPYSLHQTTKLISTPILCYELLSFDPSSCPNVAEPDLVEQSMQETESEVDFMRNALNNLYYCRECHPELSEAGRQLLFNKFESHEPLKYIQSFLAWCVRNLSRFRLFRSLDALCNHTYHKHGSEVVIGNTATISDWLRQLTLFQGHYNTQQYELLVLAFLYLLMEKKYIVTSVPESIEKKMKGLNLIPSDQ